MDDLTPEANTTIDSASRAQKTPMVASIRFKSEAQAKRFFAVYNARKNAKRLKDRSETVSDFIQDMFDYVEPNPYADFYTGN